MSDSFLPVYNEKLYNNDAGAYAYLLSPASALQSFMLGRVVLNYLQNIYVRRLWGLSETTAGLSPEELSYVNDIHTL